MKARLSTDSPRHLISLFDAKSGSDGKSVFGLLLSIEQKIGKRVRGDVPRRLETHEAFKLVNQRWRAIFKLSRYVE